MILHVPVGILLDLHPKPSHFARSCWHTTVLGKWVGWVGLVKGGGGTDPSMWG